MDNSLSPTISPLPSIIYVSFDEDNDDFSESTCPIIYPGDELLEYSDTEEEHFDQPKRRRKSARFSQAMFLLFIVISFLLGSAVLLAIAFLTISQYAAKLMTASPSDVIGSFLYPRGSSKQQLKTTKAKAH
mmetsp:Transcript_32474/g.55341  ORF Transcript_32474/g.55341 Transcript_32474/m.55341 type:complete len:131 (+) Transcript_32474:114-506(+)|eukprot:CAMPEP_0183705636 /NCGR_PEP_ID=MMETSP0737-20130205/2682_1 /TAXON_ID=385413 /ORGANISM="Thalassiosira miniscula, Strain CCMP1093" /LENGTH=130 /DNA_ID=CAMNT_0025932839 /DNA_START=55 /DNA_END=447 /DNA_ORIENTATION=-